MYDGGETKGEEKDEREAVEYLENSTVPDFLARAVQFYESRPFNEALDAFVQRHAHSFKDSAEAKTDEEVEHHLEYSALHEQYLSEFETNLSEFLTGEGCSSAEFFSQCQDALDDKYVALFDEHEHHWFVDALHASLSYERFFTLMIDECRKQHQQHK